MVDNGIMTKESCVPVVRVSVVVSLSDKDVILEPVTLRNHKHVLNMRVTVYKKKIDPSFDPIRWQGDTHRMLPPLQ